MNRAARHAGAGQFRAHIVGDLAVGQQTGIARHIVVDAGDQRRGWWGHVNGQGVGTGDRADVARAIGGDGGKDVLTFRQHGGRREAPGTRGAGGDGANQLNAVVDGDAAARFRRARQGWGVVVGAAVVGDVAGNRPDVIVGPGDDWGVRSGIHHQGEGFRTRAFVPGRIGGAEGQGVGAIIQRLGQGDAPGSGVTHRRGADQGIVGVKADHIAWGCRAGEGRQVIIGRSATDHRTGLRANVVHHAAKRWGGRWGEIDIDRRPRRLAAGLVVDSSCHAEAVAAFSQGI